MTACSLAVGGFSALPRKASATVKPAPTSAKKPPHFARTETVPHHACNAFTGSSLPTPATAYGCTGTALSGVCGCLVRRDAFQHNPVRDVSKMERSRRQAQRQVLNRSDALPLLKLLDADPYAARKNLVRLLLATGMRLGDALALSWDDVDMERGVVRVEATIVRVRGQGLVRKTTKSVTSQPVLLLPAWCVAMVRRRRDSAAGSRPVFPDAVRGWRDLKNVSRDLRTVRAGTDFEWFVSHTARRTVATLLDEQGRSARSIADQLGHARVSMTQDVYMGGHPRAPTSRETLGKAHGPTRGPSPGHVTGQQRGVGRWPAVMVRHQGLEPRTR
jgi:site-specific recombinase XerC